MAKKIMYVIKNEGEWAKNLKLNQIYDVYKDTDKDLIIIDDMGEIVLLTDKKLNLTNMNINSRIDSFKYVKKAKKNG